MSTLLLSPPRHDLSTTRLLPRVRIGTLTAVAELSELAASHVSFHEFVEETLRLVTHALDLEFAAVLVQDAPGQRFTLRYAIGWPRQLIGLAVGVEPSTVQTTSAPLADSTVVIREMPGEHYELDGALLREQAIVSGVCIAFPAWIDGRAVLAVHSRRRRTFHLDDLEFLQIAANMMGVAATLRQLELETIHCHRRLAVVERERQHLAEQVIIAREEERQQLAYDVHDELAQLATGAHHHLQAFARAHRPRSVQARSALQRAIDLTSRTVREVRRVIDNLIPSALEGTNLVTAIRLLVEDLRAEGWTVWYQENLGNVRLSPMLETTLYRVAQEALTNVRKHAQTTRVRVVLHWQDDVVRLEVQDWGRGFDPQAVGAISPCGGHVGLKSMRDRIALLNGRFTLESQPNLGTRVIAELPMALRMERDGDGHVGD